MNGSSDARPALGAGLPGRALGVVDIGSNSIHMIIVRFAADGTFERIARHKETVRLAEGLEASGHRLTREAMRRGLDALYRCREFAHAHGAAIRAVATSAVRDAHNRAEWIGEVRTEVGLDIEVVSGYEEARLIFLGVLGDPRLAGRRMLEIDIGGGSAEFVLGGDGEVDFASSLPLGGVRLGERFFPGGDATPRAVRECRDWVEARLQPVVRELSGGRRDGALCSAGTAGAIIAMTRLRREGREPIQLHGSRATLEEVSAVVAELCAAGKLKVRRKIPGIDERRADILPAGGIVLESAMRALGIAEIEWTSNGLREGIVRDTWERRERSVKLPELSDWRRRGVEALARHFSLDPGHDRQVERLAQKLFMQTAPLHGLDENAGELLEAAALLHETGLRIGLEEHHKHSYYVIRHSHLLTGFNDREVEIVANVARYHRKSHPKASHPQWMALAPADREVVRRLAGILRVADGLDRRHVAAVDDIFCRIDGRDVVCRARAREGTDIAMELWSAESKKELFEQSLDARIRFLPTV